MTTITTELFIDFIFSISKGIKHLFLIHLSTSKHICARKQIHVVNVFLFTLYAFTIGCKTKYISTDSATFRMLNLFSVFVRDQITTSIAI